MKWRFGIIGGDRRQAELARMLAQDGHFVTTYGLDSGENMLKGRLEQALSADVVILPLPLCAKPGIITCAAEEIPVEALLEQLQPTQLILGGRVKTGGTEDAAQARGLRLRDYFLREELTVANAAATAEAALQVAMEHMDRTLLGTNCLVLGFGRIGKLLSFRLHGLGAQVTAAARKASDRAWIRAYGWNALDTAALAGELGPFPVVFNTVPSLLLDEQLLKELPGGCLYMELASVPGAEICAAERLGVHCIRAAGLPGQLVPATAAEAIREAVYQMILEERGDPV
ncbi:MAG: dipicolinate synthase subunit DpsA [Dysosmobacter sp.]